MTPLPPINLKIVIFSFLLTILLFKVPQLQDGVSSVLKSLICPKIKLDHMARPVYSPGCMQYCSEICGIR